MFAGSQVLLTSFRFMAEAGETCNLKVGETNRVVRPMGMVQAPSNGSNLGFYYRDIGAVRIESIQ